MSSVQDECIFCKKINCKVIEITKYFFIIRDTSYPVTKHHTLIVTNRHVSDYFDLNFNEIEVAKLPHAPKGKKIKDIEVIISLKKN